MLTQEETKARLRYSKTTGRLVWLSSGKAAGCLDSHSGYVRVMINQKSYSAHRVIWTYLYGYIPDGFVIDHRNGIRNDNRLKNLRCVTPAENQQNQRRPQHGNSTGFLGVWFEEARDRYRAKIKVAGKVKYLGIFHTAEEAHQAYLLAKRELHAGCTI